MKNLRLLHWFAGVVVLGFVLGSSVGARAYDAPPQRAARLSYLQGSVTVEHMDNTGNDPAVINMPLAAGVRVSTGEDGQAEVEFEDGSLVRLTPNSALSLSVLSADNRGNFQTQLAVVHGLVYAELRADAKFAYSIDANGDAISPVTNTTIRIDLDEPPAVISVLDGTAHVGSQSGDQADVQSGETLTRDSTDGSRYLVTQEIAQDSWDSWNEDRDQAAADEAANQTEARDDYAGSQGYGWSDLDANGTWYNVPGQGMVWQPNVAADAGFDPYGYGSWVYYPGTGYVWASGYNWGWTPFRCGNWSYWDGFGWGWLPGSGCGLGGWGFGGGGYVINVIRPPQTYRFPMRPVHREGPPRPIHIGRPSRAGNPSAPDFRGPRSIAGRTAEPLRPVGRGTTPRGGSAVGSSLRRDYPVDRNSHRPELGVTAPATGPGASPGRIQREPGRPGGSRPVNPQGGNKPQGGDSGSSLRRGTMRPPPPATDSTQGERSGRGRGDRPVQQVPPQTASPQPPVTPPQPVQPTPAPRPSTPPQPSAPRPEGPRPERPRQEMPRPETPRQEVPRPQAPRQEAPRPQRPQEPAPRPAPSAPGPRSVPQPSLRPESRPPSAPPAPGSSAPPAANLRR